MRRTITSALPLLLGNICLLFLLLAGGFFSFVSAYGLPVSGPALLAGCVCCSILFAVLWSVPQGGWAALALLGLDVLAVWRLWEELEPAASVLWEAASGGDYPAKLWYHTGEDPDLLPALLLLMAALAFILGWLTVRERCWHLPAVLVVLPLISALMSGVLPDLLPLLAETAGWGTLLLTSLYNRNDPASLGKGLWMSLGGISALLLLLLALLPREGYYRPDWATNTRDHVVETVNRAFTAFWNGGGGGGTAWNLDFGISVPSGDELDGQVDLTEAGPRRYSRQTVLQVTGGAGRTYLRGGAAGVYTGSGWEAPDESEYGELPYPADLFPALTAPDGTPAETLTIRHVRGRGKTAYMPYRFLGFSEERAYTVLDSGARRRGDEYEVAYIPGGPVTGGFTPLANGPEAWERRYRDFVYSHYLDVPAEARDALRQMMEHMLDLAASGGLPDPPDALCQRFQEPAYLAMCAAKLLGQMAVYDLDVPAMEPGEDFLTHFLEEGRGYCVHFATAGALLLRLEGIPTRYVEGYAPLLSESGTSSVRDSDAHAWVEIYLDGYGWYPVEMTPGRQGETPEMVAPEILQTETPPETPEEEPPVEAEKDSEDNQRETPGSTEEADTAEEPEKEPADLSWLWKAAVVLLILAAPYGGYRLALLIGKKQREHPDTNRSVIYAYVRYQRLLRQGGPEEPELEELGRKAKFSQHQLTEEERAAAWKCADHAAGTLKSKKRGWRNKK